MAHFWRRAWHWFGRDEQIALVLCGAVLAVCGVIQFSRWRAARPLPPFFQDVPPASTQAGTMIQVHVTGAVQHPGVQQLPVKARVRDAVRAAGGAWPNGDGDALNLAAPLQDGQQIVVPERHAAAAVAVTPVAGSSAAKINVNTAAASELETLPGIGPELAARMIAYRRQHGPLRAVEDLAPVPGLGAKKLDALRPYVTF